MPMNEGRDGFETQPCGRCGGSGWHSYCQTWGHTCFQCGVKPHQQGLGRHLTKRGSVAHAFYVASLPTKRAADLMPGDIIREYSQWCLVRAVRDNKVDHASGVVLSDGTVEYKGVNITIGGEKNPVTLCAVADDTLYPVKPSDEERARLRATALAYQETLTKAGKPRKRCRVAA